KRLFGAIARKRVSRTRRTSDCAHEETLVAAGVDSRRFLGWADFGRVGAVSGWRAGGSKPDGPERELSLHAGESARHRGVACGFGEGYRGSDSEMCAATEGVGAGEFAGAVWRSRRPMVR